jgi:hypothetical protein
MVVDHETHSFDDYVKKYGASNPREAILAFAATLPAEAPQPASAPIKPSEKLREALHDMGTHSPVMLEVLGDHLSTAQAEEVLRRTRAAAPLSETAHSGTAKVPEGWKLVPVEPPYKMLGEGMGAALHVPPDEILARHVYKAMLAAAPVPSGNEESK